MADFFFGFDTSFAHPSLEDELDCPLEEDDVGEEEEYDALNDETFGSEATIGDWEKDHEKLAEIAESSRPQQQTSTVVKKNGVDVDIEDNLSHLVLDEKDGIVPRPGVWDSPSNLSLAKSHQPLTLQPTLKNVCTVEELEKGLIANRTAALQQNKTAQVPLPQAQKSEESVRFDALSLNQKLQINGLPPPRFPPGLGIPPPHPVVLPPNMRFPHPQFMQHPRLLPNQAGNMMRYPLPAHLMMPHPPQRQPLHGSYCGNFPQPPHTNLGPPPFLRADHGLMPGFANNQNNHQQQHSFPHSGNQRLPNRSFHQPDQQGNHQPFFKSNQYLYRNQDRNNQRHYQYHHQSHLMNETTGSGEYDEYAGLMSDREKQFLITIQLLQLNMNEPYVEDYYYTVFRDRQKKLNADPTQRVKKQLSNNGNFKDSRDRDQQPPVLARSTYTPMQFENSLGKLQFCSITAPRKVIDMDVVSNNDSQSQQKDTKKTRQLLLEIERLYIIQLKLEDLSNPLAISNSDRQTAEKDGGANVKKSAPELIQSLLTSLQQLIQDDKFTSMLSIRKAKTLLLRFLPHLNVTEYHVQLEELWCAVLRGLAIIGRRDSNLLTSLHAELRRWLKTVQDFNTLNRLAAALSDSAGQSTKNNNLAFAVTNKFGVSTVASMIEQAETLIIQAREGSLLASASPKWAEFIVNFADAIGETSLFVAPDHPISVKTLNQHLSRFPILKSEKYTSLEVLLTDANPSR